MVIGMQTKGGELKRVTSFKSVRKILRNVPPKQMAPVEGLISK